MRIRIDKLVYGGFGLARTEQGVIFVPRTAPGDLVEAEIVQQKKDYAVAHLIRVLDPSPDRQEPFCPNCESAGCCHWQHIRYARQVDHKEAIIRESLERIGHIRWTGPIRRITGPDRNYRLRATFHVRNNQLGFLKERSNEIVPVQECAALVEELNEFIPYANSILLPGMREVHAVSGPAIAASFIFEDGTAKRITRGGQPILDLEGTRYRVSAQGFFQANRFLLASFIHEVLGQLGPAPARILELYAGSGFFSIPLARVAEEVIGVEANQTAVKLARENIRLNHIQNLRVYAAHVETVLQRIRMQPDVVVLNPPRTGCGVKSTARIAELSPTRIVCVSCNPTTLAREISVLVSRGYELQRVTLVDQFPNTYHIEMVVALALPSACCT